MQERTALTEIRYRRLVKVVMERRGSGVEL